MHKASCANSHSVWSITWMPGRTHGRFIAFLFKIISAPVSHYLQLNGTQIIANFSIFAFGTDALCNMPKKMKATNGIENEYIKHISRNAEESIKIMSSNQSNGISACVCHAYGCLANWRLLAIVCIYWIEPIRLVSISNGQSISGDLSAVAGAIWDKTFLSHMHQSNSPCGKVNPLPYCKLRHTHNNKRQRKWYSQFFVRSDALWFSLVVWSRLQTIGDVLLFIWIGTKGVLTQSLSNTHATEECCITGQATTPLTGLVLCPCNRCEERRKKEQPTAVRILCAD